MCKYVYIPYVNLKIYTHVSLIRYNLCKKNWYTKKINLSLITHWQLEVRTTHTVVQAIDTIFYSLLTPNLGFNCKYYKYVNKLYFFYNKTYTTNF